MSRGIAETLQAYLAFEPERNSDVAELHKPIVSAAPRPLYRRHGLCQNR
ncbi:hypothetical protein [Bradyrhizobium guangdongense]